MTGVIRDPNTGQGAVVDGEGRLAAYSSVASELAHISEAHGASYSWTAVSADIDTGDTALYVANDHQDKNLHITKIYVWADVACQFKIHCPAYVTPAGTAVVGNNLNRVSGNAAQATAKADETGNVFAAANVVATVRNSELATAEEGQWVDFEGALILGYHDSVAVDLIGESAAFECTIFGFFH